MLHLLKGYSAHGQPLNFLPADVGLPRRFTVLQNGERIVKKSSEIQTGKQLGADRNMPTVPELLRKRIGSSLRIRAKIDRGRSIQSSFGTDQRWVMTRKRFL